MGIEAPMGQADLFHDVGDARAVVPAAPNGARGGPDDPFVGDLFAAGGDPPGGGCAHMMSIIYQSGAERKAASLPLTPPTQARRQREADHGRVGGPSLLTSAGRRGSGGSLRAASTQRRPRRWLGG